MSDAARGAWLATMGVAAAPRSHDAEVETALDTLAEHLEKHVDVGRLLSLAC
jgi:adenosylcobyric acid synthase